MPNDNVRNPADHEVDRHRREGVASAIEIAQRADPRISAFRLTPEAIANDDSTLRRLFNEVYGDHLREHYEHTILTGSSLMDSVYGNKTKIKIKTEFKDTMDKEVYDLETMGYRHG